MVAAVLTFASMASGLMGAHQDPNDATYTYSDSTDAHPFAPVYSWNDIAQPENMLPRCDDCTFPVPIGFDFTFYGQTYDTIYASTNGFLSFNEGDADGCCSGMSLPHSSNSRWDPSNLVAGYWTDLDPRFGGGMFAKTDYSIIGSIAEGALPSPDTFTLQYESVPHYYGARNTDFATYQIVLHAVTNQIDIVFKEATPDDDPWHTHSIGTMSAFGEDGVPAQGTQYAYGTGEELMFSEHTVRFFPGLG